MFITFEGPDFCGKTRLARKLVKSIKGYTTKVFYTFEPGDKKSYLSRKLRHFLLNLDLNHVDPFSLALLFSAERWEHLKKVILPKLKDNHHVICDRYVDSTIIYQALVNDNYLLASKIEKLSYEILSAPIPNLTFVIVSDYKKIKTRMLEAKVKKFTNFDLQDEEYFQNLINAYKKLAKSNSRYFLVENNDSFENCFLEIQERTMEIINYD